MALPGYFRVDDYVYLADIRLGHFSLWHWLGAVYFQHFAPGHRIRLDLLQADNPTFRPSSVPSSIDFGAPALVLPTHEATSRTLPGATTTP